MDPGVIALFIPIVALLCMTAVGIARLRCVSPPASAGAGVEARRSALEQEVTLVRHELNEAQERPDFAERLLTQRRDGRDLAPPSPSGD